MRRINIYFARNCICIFIESFAEQIKISFSLIQRNFPSYSWVSKLSVKILWSRLDSCNLKDLKSNLKGIFDIFAWFVGRKNALNFSELITWCQTGTFNAFWSRDEFGKRLGHQADFKIFLSGTLDPSVSVHCVFLILFPKLKMSEWKYNKWISVYE